MTRPHTRHLSLTTAVIAIALAALLTGCSSGSGPTSFATPDDAAKALADGIRADDTAKLLSLLGKDAKEIVSSGDDVEDRNRRQHFLTLYDQRHALTANDDDPDARTLVVGNADWPFPIPIVKNGDKWSFDAAAGREEILNRRIGENELSTIEVIRAVGDAQREYAERDLDGDGIAEYARKFASEPGQRDGLYWPAKDGEPASPLGELVVAATAEGYARREQGRTPYHGYFYRILESQGASAPNGAVDYVVNDQMILGFAVVAWPAEYDSSGIMTFIMGPDGAVYQKDLGEQTDNAATLMKAFDPGEGWEKVVGGEATASK